LGGAHRLRRRAVARPCKARAATRWRAGRPRKRRRAAAAALRPAAALAPPAAPPSTRAAAAARRPGRQRRRPAAAAAAPWRATGPRRRCRTQRGGVRAVSVSGRVVASHPAAAAKPRAPSAGSDACAASARDEARAARPAARHRRERIVAARWCCDNACVAARERVSAARARLAGVLVARTRRGARQQLHHRSLAE
jgi:hypothetical protein